jgi:hypothetical protein
MKPLLFLLLTLLSLAGCGQKPSTVSPENLEALGELRLTDPGSAVIKLKQQLELTVWYEKCRGRRRS